MMVCWGGTECQSHVVGPLEVVTNSLSQSEGAVAGRYDLLTLLHDLQKKK